MPPTISAPAIPKNNARRRNCRSRCSGLGHFLRERGFSTCFIKHRLASPDQHPVTFYPCRMSPEQARTFLCRFRYTELFECFLANRTELLPFWYYAITRTPARGVPKMQRQTGSRRARVVALNNL